MALALFAFPPPVVSQPLGPAFLVRDIRAQRTSVSSSPSDFVALRGAVYFTASSQAFDGRELWRTDGTIAGTRLVRDVFAGAGAAFAPQRTGSLTAVGPLLLFAAYEPDGGLELWRSDGSEQGTRRVQDIAAGSASASPYGITEAGATVFFGANDSLHGAELWAMPRVALNPACAGDCDEDGAVVVAELQLGVNLLLERSDPSACVAVDRNLDGRVTVAELIAAVGRTLGSCTAQ